MVGNAARLPRTHGGARPGAGRKPQALRRAFRHFVDTVGLPYLYTLMAREDAKDADRLRAVELAGRYGIGEQTRQELTGANGGPIKQTTTIDLATAPADDLAKYRELAKRQMVPSDS